MATSLVRSRFKERDSNRFTKSEEGGDVEREEEEHLTRRQFGVLNSFVLKGVTGT